NAFKRDPACALGEGPRLSDAIEAIHTENNVGGFGGNGRTTSAHGHTYVGQGEGRCVVDAVSYHDGGCASTLRAYDVELLGRGTLGEHLVPSGARTDGLGDLGAVARHHDDPLDAVSAEGADCPRGIGPQGIIEHQNARW